MTVFERVKALAAEWGGTWFYNVLCHTLRLEIENDEPLEGLRQRYGAVIFAGWHSQLLVPLWHHRYNDGYAVVSEHADGELIARVLERIGYTCIRGSTTRGAARALIRMVKIVRQGHDIGVTPDGPLGPRYIAQPGVVFLSAKSGCPIVAMGFASRWFWQFNSWDKFKLPKPCSRGAIVYGQPIHVPAKVADADVERWRQRVQDSLMAATRRAESLCGLPPEPESSPEPAG